MPELAFAEDLRQVRDMLSTVISLVGAANANIESLKERLFNNGSGAIPALWDKYNGIAEIARKAASDVETKASKEDVAQVSTRAEIRRAYVIGWAAGAAAIVSAVITALGFGFRFLYRAH